jgi:hypothetical protein
MKKLIVPVLGLLFAIGLMSALTVDIGFAQAQGGLITDTDRPQTLINATTRYEGSFRTALTTIVNYFLFFLGLIATIMVIYGGFLYITAGGDDAGAEKGKKILMYAAIGLIVVLISYALVNTILASGSIEAPEV